MTDYRRPMRELDRRRDWFWRCVVAVCAAGTFLLLHYN